MPSGNVSLDFDVGQQKSWTPVGGGLWIEVLTSKELKYWYNSETNESTWTEPSPAELAKSKTQTPALPEPRENDVIVMKQILCDLKIPKFASYESTVSKLLSDERFFKIRKENRKSVFQEALKEMRNERKKPAEERHKTIQALRTTFSKFLKQKKFDPNLASYQEIEQLFKDDPVFEASNEKLRKNCISTILLETKRDSTAQSEKSKSSFRSLIERKLQLIYSGKALDEFPDWEAFKLRYKVPSSSFDEIEDPEAFYLQVCSSISNSGSKKRSLEGPTREAMEDKRKKADFVAAIRIFETLITEKFKAPFSFSSSEIEKFLMQDEELRSLPLTRGFKITKFEEFASMKKAERLLNYSNLLKTLENKADMSLEESLVHTGVSDNPLFKGISLEDFAFEFDKLRTSRLLDLEKIFIDFLQTSNVISQKTDLENNLQGVLKLLAKDPRYKVLDEHETLRLRLIRNRVAELQSEKLARDKPKVELWGHVREEGEPEEDSIQFLQLADQFDEEE